MMPAGVIYVIDVFLFWPYRNNQLNSLDSKPSGDNGQGRDGLGNNADGNQDGSGTNVCSIKCLPCSSQNISIAGC